MGHIDRYIFRQLVSLFGFFALVLVSVYWVNQAARIFDSLIADGQSVGVFLEFSALALPWIMQLILPVAAFVATLYIFNRLINESELVVLQTAGLSAGRLLRPVVFFGLFMAILIGALSHALAPTARGMLMDRQEEVSDDLTGRFLRAGEVLHPARGLTVYIRDISDLGEFRDLFLQDASTRGVEVTYTATNAILVRSDTGPRLVMFDGIAQTLDLETGRLATVQFNDFTYDVGALINESGVRRIDARELPTPVLLAATPELAEQFGLGYSRMVFEGHDRFSQMLFVFFVPMIAAASLMLGTFSRLGVWKQILIAVAIVLPMQLVRNAAETVVRDTPELWVVAYTQPISAAFAALVLVALAMRPRRSWRAVPA